MDYFGLLRTACPAGLAVVLLGAIAFAPAAAAPAGSVRIGVATVDVTPPMGMPMAGYYHPRGADGILDPLFSKAMVLESGGERAAIVAVDIISVTRAITDQARAEIEKSTGIKGGNVMISATHAHTGPELANRGKRGADYGAQSRMSLEYTTKLPQRIAESVRLANQALQPANLSYTRGLCEQLGFNRRYFMRDGSVSWNPGKLNPNVVMPAGVSDPEVGILYAEKPDGSSPTNSIATFVNFAMHPDTTGGSKFSADWPGALSRVLASYHGPKHVTVVANGTCGNINHLDNTWKWESTGPFEQNRIAAVLGGSVFQAYKTLKPLSAGPIRARSEIVELALPTFTAEQVEQAKQTIARTKDDQGSNFMALVRSYRVLDLSARAGKPHRVEVQVVTFGKSLAWVGLPGEIFVELGLAVKKFSPFAQTFVAELTNENIGYIPDRRSYAEGNYEPESARCAAGSGEKVVDAAVNLLKALYNE